MGALLKILWAFNEEIVARAIFGCNTPVISAVGHETDFTIADYVSDMRAPTPSAAAEIAVFEYDKFIAELEDKKQGMLNAFRYKLNDNKRRIKDIEWKLNKLSPANMINSKRQRVADSEIRLAELMNSKLMKRRHSLNILAERLNGLSPLNKISGGYAYVSDSEGKPIRSVEDVKIGDDIEIVVKDGKMITSVKQIR